MGHFADLSCCPYDPLYKREYAVVPVSTIDELTKKDR